MLDLSLLLAQLVIILAAARVAGALARRIGQPPVVGEMAAGLALGPSLLGAVAPGTAAAIFPATQLTPLATLSQLGVLLFMFVVGLRLDAEVLRGRTRTAVATSHASIAVPFALGLLVAPRLYPDLAGPGVAPRAFALFVGTAMSVTAFPVLARILADRGLLNTQVGAVAIASAAVDDVTAWCVLGAVVAVARAGSGWSVAAAVGGLAVYVAFALLAGRPLLRRALTTSDAALAVPVAVLVALGSALVTERLGVHALFGAFLAGVVTPREHGVAAAIADRLESAVTTVLLPIFFAFTGLRTQLGLVHGAAAWSACALVFAVAVTGKLGGAAVAARVSGMAWRDAFAIGALMNTRGLMELVVLNLGLEMGVISPALFAMMVLMALVTTAMTSPLVTLAGARARLVALP